MSTLDAANRLLSTTGTGASTYSNDADGNTLTGGGRTSTWDSQNCMVSCTKNGVTSTYTYGADGLRRSSTVSGVTTYYAYDGQTMIREMKRNTQTGALFNTATYFQGPRGSEYRRDDTQTEIDSQGRQVSVCRWYVYDGLGSVVGEVDPSGNLTSSPKYDVYGAVRGNAGAASTRQGFVGGLGHVSDTETGLVYMRARYYDPQQGRFISQDSKHVGGNWYRYCDDNPTNELDKNGKDPFSIGLSSPELIASIQEAISEGANFAEVLDECFGGDVYFASGIQGAVGDAKAILTFDAEGDVTLLPGVEAEAEGIPGQFIADQEGIWNLARMVTNAELIDSEGATAMAVLDTI